MKLEVVFKTTDFIAVNKPAGLLVHKSSYQKTREATLADWIKKEFPQTKKVGDSPEFRPGIVHRLDKDTSGIILVALNQKYFDYLKKLFMSGGIKKNYLAVVSGEVKEKRGVINKAIGIKPGTTKRSVYSSKMSKEAITEFELLGNFEKNGQKFSLLSVRPLTGRTHQIRVHLASLGFPVAGDPIYGGKANKLSAPRLMLHALSLEFENESGGRIKLEALPPGDFSDFLSANL